MVRHWNEDFEQQKEETGDQQDVIAVLVLRRA